MEMDRKSPLSRSEVWQTWQNFSISPFLRFNPYPRLSMRWREERQLVARIKNEREGGEGGGLEVYLKNASVLFLRSFGHLSSTGGIHFVAGRFLWPIQRDRDSVPVVNIPTLDVFVSPSRKLPFSCTPN